VGTFSFKSSGKTQEQRLVEKIEKTKTPIGIKTPLQLNDGAGTEIFVTYDNLADTVHDNLRNLLLTNWGERLGLYDFGANLRPLLTELVSSDDFDGQIMERISNAVARWMPYVSLENFESKIDRSKSGSESLAHINVKITYSVPSLGVSNKLLEITLNAM
jgi:phage baseplate assembly protein W